MSYDIWVMKLPSANAAYHRLSLVKITRLNPCVTKANIAQTSRVAAFGGTVSLRLSVLAA
jgi:hypothetical protein